MDGVSLSVLIGSVSVAFFHTLLGPDHTLPFIMLARARDWSTSRALLVTFLCGLGHVGSSLLLGGLGIALGYGIGALESAEQSRGAWAAWALFAFGFAYMVWGLRLAWRRRSGLSLHDHAGHVHVHGHGHGDHAHAHDNKSGSRTTFWVLFAIFVLGPCEPLIAFFMVPASKGNWTLAVTTAIAFTVVTLATMLGLVALGLAGYQRLPLGRLERWSEFLAGATVALCGLVILFVPGA
jgi:ABC-type nickel/cobalt efflux system permease component RcnA